MVLIRRGLAAGVVVLLALFAWGFSGRLAQKAKAASAGRVREAQAHPRVLANYGKLPLSFEVNRGQTDGRVKFLARGRGYDLFLTSREAVLSLRKSEARSAGGEKFENADSGRIAARTQFFEGGPSRETGLQTAVLRMRIVGANGEAQVKGEEELPGKSNYFVGKDPKSGGPTYRCMRRCEWRTFIPASTWCTTERRGGWNTTLWLSREVTRRRSALRSARQRRLTIKATCWPKRVAGKCVGTSRRCTSRLRRKDAPRERRPLLREITRSTSKRQWGSPSKDMTGPRFW